MKIHLAVIIDAVGDDPVIYARCGSSSKRLAVNPLKVTCLHCLKKVKKLK